MHLGQIDERLAAARHALAHAAACRRRLRRATDGGRTLASDDERAAGRLLARRVRAVVARACEDVLQQRRRTRSGPAPLAQEEDHAKRVADLQVYVRQHHAERDDASLGGALAASLGRAVVTFDGRAPGTPADDWSADAAARRPRPRSACRRTAAWSSSPRTRTTRRWAPVASSRSSRRPGDPPESSS